MIERIEVMNDEKDLDSDMLRAVVAGDVERVRALIDAGVDPNDCEDSEGSTALHLAAHHGNAAIVDCLMVAGADDQANDAAGRHPIHDAAYSGNLEAFDLLATSPEMICSLDDDCCQPAHYAAMAGNTEILRRISHLGVFIDDVDTNHFTPLAYACDFGHFDTARFLVNEAGANPTVALHRMANVLARQPGVVALLVELGAQARATEPNDWTPLLSGLQSRKTDFVRDLLTYATVEQDDLNLALAMAYRYRDSDKEVVSLLLEAGADARVLEIVDADLHAFSWGQEFEDMTRHLRSCLMASDIEQAMSGGDDVPPSSSKGFSL